MRSVVTFALCSALGALAPGCNYEDGSGDPSSQCAYGALPSLPPVYSNYGVIGNLAGSETGAQTSDGRVGFLWWGEAPHPPPGAGAATKPARSGRPRGTSSDLGGL